MSIRGRLYVLRSNWGARPCEAQAAEYAEVVGRDALARQWVGSIESRRRVDRLLGRRSSQG